MADLGELPNLGSHSVEQLKAVGIETAEDLVALGADGRASLVLARGDVHVRAGEPVRRGMFER